MAPDDVPAEVRAYYERGDEARRLLEVTNPGPLELARTQELLTRYLPPGPLDILDVGGGPGVYAAWLADLGHRVHLVDPVQLHVAQARESHASLTAEIGDARALSQTSASADVVLLMGPLYHLTERADRLKSLRETVRVLRPGGLLFAVAIGRYAAFADLLIRLGRFHEPEVRDLVEEAISSWVFRGPRSGLFTTAYFPRSDELAAEVAEVGLDEIAVFNIEGPGFVTPDFAERWNDASKREALQHAARLVEHEPQMMAFASHLLAVARKPAP